MRAEIRDRLAEKIPLSPAKLEGSVLTGTLQTQVPLTVDNRVYMRLRGPEGEFEMQIPENVAHNYKSRYGKAPGFNAWFAARIRDLLNAS